MIRYTRRPSIKETISIVLVFTVLFVFPAVRSEEQIDGIIKKWEEQYGDYRMWNYQINAAFAEQESWRYAWNPSMRPIWPDESAISSEEAQIIAYQLIPEYECGFTSEMLENLTCIVSSYRKPEDDTDFWSKEGTWIIHFWETTGKQPSIMCTFYINAKSGIPIALLLSSGTYYIGLPENAIVVEGNEG